MDIKYGDADLGFIHKFILGGQKDDGFTLLLLHGTGGDEKDLLSIAQMISKSASSIISPRGKVLENGMPRFFRRFAEGVFDLADLKFRTNELADFVIKASDKYKFDPHRVVALGYSNGANIAASMLLLRPESLSHAILFRAMIPLVPDKLPDLSDKKVFISAGRYDTVILATKVKELVALLERANAKVTLNWEESTHSLTTGDIEKARTFWLTKL
ncbi:MAG: alpha/beta hydrolase [Nitrososphaerales archaeon]